MLRIDPVTESDGERIVIDEDDGFDLNEPFGGVGE